MGVEFASPEGISAASAHSPQKSPWDPKIDEN
jgi:hypothetical protein